MHLEYFHEKQAILIHGQPQIVAHVRGKLQALADGLIDRLAVHELPGLTSIDGCQLTAHRGTWDSGTQPYPQPSVFQSSLLDSTWHNIVGLLQPFSDGSYFAGNHQILDGHGKFRLIISGGRDW